MQCQKSAEVYRHNAVILNVVGIICGPRREQVNKCVIDIVASSSSSISILVVVRGARVLRIHVIALVRRRPPV